MVTHASSSAIYRRIARPLAFAASRSDAEQAHEKALFFLSWLGRKPHLLRGLKRLKAPDPALHTQLLGCDFNGVVGLAAGFDKQATASPALAAIFDFIEVGTVLRSAQAGNLRPRVFRVPGCDSLINRMGFNSVGVDQVVENIAGQGRSVPLLGNVGKMATTPPEQASEEYASVAAALAPYVGAIVVNVSSPNTKGLRALQRPESVDRIVRAVRLASGKPTLLKLDPDMPNDAFCESIWAAEVAAVDGYVLGNTSISRPGMSGQVDEAGGYSGIFLYPRVREMVALARAITRSKTIIACGGINSADRAYQLLSDGADLIENLHRSSVRRAIPPAPNQPGCCLSTTHGGVRAHQRASAEATGPLTDDWATDGHRHWRPSPGLYSLIAT